MAKRSSDRLEQRIAELETQIRDLRIGIVESERTSSAREISLLEDGLRLAQENEMLRRELSALRERPRSATRKTTRSRGA
jgi:hypothetical protein